jgi:hypothetical protein
LGAWVQGGQARRACGDRWQAVARQPHGIVPRRASGRRIQRIVGSVIGQLRMEPEANEITAALQLLKTLPLKDVIVTGDAMFTQREICRVIKDGGGDYFFTVKDNQPALKADMALAFGPISPLGDMDAAA